LNVITLAAGSDSCDGWYKPGIVAVCAWPRELSSKADLTWYVDHCLFLERIGVPVERDADSEVVCHFSEPTARAYQLLHVLLHELGHHHDLMTTQSRNDCGRGEPYAEKYAYRHEALVWERYLNDFGLF
jgi:hypothetical protein